MDLRRRPRILVSAILHRAHRVLTGWLNGDAGDRWLDAPKASRLADIGTAGPVLAR